MKNLEARIEAGKVSVNRQRELDNEIRVGGQVVAHLHPKDKGYLPPTENFVTFFYHNGFIVVDAEFFGKLSKRKSKMLMKP